MLLNIPRKICSLGRTCSSLATPSRSVSSSEKENVLIEEAESWKTHRVFIGSFIGAKGLPGSSGLRYKRDSRGSSKNTRTTSGSN